MTSECAHKADKGPLAGSDSLHNQVHQPLCSSTKVNEYIMNSWLRIMMLTLSIELARKDNFKDSLASIFSPAQSNTEAHLARNLKN